MDLLDRHRAAYCGDHVRIGCAGRGVALWRHGVGVHGALPAQRPVAVSGLRSVCAEHDGDGEAADDRGHHGRDRWRCGGAVAGRVAQRDPRRERQEAAKPRHQPDDGGRAQHQSKLDGDHAGEEERLAGAPGTGGRGDDADGGEPRAEHHPAPPGSDDPPAASQRGYHILPGRDPGRHQRGQHTTGHCQNGENSQRHREQPEFAGPLMCEVNLHQWPYCCGGRYAQHDADDRGEQAEHHTVGQHDTAHLRRGTPSGGNQRQIAAAAARAHRESRSGKQDDLQHRQPADEHEHREHRPVVVHEVGVPLILTRRVCQHVPGDHDHPVGVELLDLRPGQRIRGGHEPGHVARA